MSETIEGVVIPDPNPANFWPFKIAESRLLAAKPGESWTLTLIQLGNGRAELRCSGQGEAAQCCT